MIFSFTAQLARSFATCEADFSNSAEQQALCQEEPNASLGVKEVEYAGHVFSSTGVAIDQGEIQVVLDWPMPKNLRAL